MAKEYIEIDSADEKDVNAMFNAICKQVIKQSPFSVKKDILDFPGEDEEIEAAQVIIQDLLEVLRIYDISYEFKLKASFTELVKPDKKKKEIFEKPPEFNGGQKPSDLHKKMEDQKAEITNPDLKEVSMAVISGPTFNTEEKKIDPGSIEDFPE